MPARFTNRARLAKKLRDYPPAIAAQIRPAMEQSANHITALQKALAPVEHGSHPRRVPGTLKDSIGWAWGSVPRKVSGMISEGTSAAGKLLISFYAGSVTAFYARFVEFGTHAGQKRTYRTSLAGNKLRRRKVYRDHPGSKAMPFFYGPFRAYAGEAKKQIAAAVRAATKSIAEKS